MISSEDRYKLNNECPWISPYLENMNKRVAGAYLLHACRNVRFILLFQVEESGEYIYIDSGTVEFLINEISRINAEVWPKKANIVALFDNGEERDCVYTPPSIKISHRGC